MKLKSGCLVLVVVLLLSSPTRSANITAWAVNNTMKVRTPISKGDYLPHFLSHPQSDNSVWDGSTKEIEICCARNEQEGFQIIISAEKGDLRGVTIDMETLTRGSDSISKANVEFLLEKYVYAPHASDNNLGAQPPWDSEAEGYWPDPLPPLIGAFDVNDGENQPVWINVRVPKGTPAGTYTADIIINADNAPSEILHLKFKVWDFTLPDKFHLRTHYAVACHMDNISEFFNLPLYESSPGPDTNPKYSTEYKRIAKKFHEILCQYHISPRWYYPQQEDFTRNGTQITIDWTDIDQWLDDLYFKYHSNAFGMGWYGFAGGASYFDYPFDHSDPNYETLVTNYMSQLADHYRQRGMIEDCYVYMDEPADVNQVEYYADLLHGIDPDIKLLTAGYPWSNKVDIIANNWLDNNGEEDVPRLLSQGIEVWKYVCNYPPYPYAAYWLDHPAIEHRILKWQCRKYNITGFLYWGVEAWHDYEGTHPSVWDEVRGEGSDGILLYPGTPDRGFDNIPIKSLRLEVIREGIEDYEYFVLLDEAGDNFAKEKIDKMVTTLSDFERDADILYEARNALGARIEELISGLDTSPPNSPRDLISPNQTANSISLSWAAPLQASDGDYASLYKVLRNSSVLGTTSNTTYLDTGLTPNTTYFYSVYSVDDTGNQSLQPATGSFNTLPGGSSDTTPPDPPTNVKVRLSGKGGGR